MKETKKSPKPYNRKFSNNWEQDDGLREWIRRVPGDLTKVSCKYCKTVMRAHRFDLKTHSETKKHKKNTALLGAISSVFEGFPNSPPPPPSTTTKRQAAATAGKGVARPQDIKAENDSSGLVMDGREGQGEGVTEIVNPASVGFIGCGNMAQAMLSAFIKKGLVNPNLATASAPSDRNLSKLRAMGVRTTHDNNDVAQSSDLVFICVKPHLLTEVLGSLDPLESHSPLFISVVTGVCVDDLELMLSNVVTDPRVVRAMPNTPSALGQGCCVYAMGSHTTPSDAEATSSLLNSLGMASEIPEYQLDAATGVMGSGPAYIYMAIEALADGGVMMGLPRQLAQRLAAQTVKGAGAMVLETGKHPGQLKDEVCSPMGTTIAAVKALEKNSFRNSLISAVEASATRAKELGSH